MDTKNPISTKAPSSDEYLPLFERILSDPQSTLSDEAVAHVRKYVKEGRNGQSHYVDELQKAFA
jgi:hypothetical protein